jgi:predicted nucleic acid-binding protein
VLRSNAPDLSLTAALRELILANRVVLIGPILQEILSGVRGKKDFDALRQRFSSYDFLVMTEVVHVKAAEYYNVCKAHGVNGGHVDFLICAAAVHYGCAVLTVDSDFTLFEKFVPVQRAFLKNRG